MKTIIGVALGLATALFSAFPAGARQVNVGPQRRVNPPDTNWFECSVAARQWVTSEVSVCATSSGAVTGLAYGISLDGGVTFTNGAFPPMPGELSAPRDSCLAIDPVTDRTWISGLVKLETGGVLRVAKREPGELVFGLTGQPNSMYTAVGFVLDKPLMGIGPPPGGAGDSGAADGQPHTLWSSFSDNPTNQLPWLLSRVEPQPNYPANDYRNWGPMPVVLNNARIVVVNRGKGESASAHYNNRLPYVVYSDGPGSMEFLDWKPDDPPPISVADGSGIDAGTIDVLENYGTPTQEGDTPFPIDKRVCVPAIAVDPATTDLYVGFYARRAPGSTNSDIYISRSTNQGATFPGGPEPNPNMFHLTDSMLGLCEEPGTICEDGPDQIMPAMAVDACGGVNLVFYDNRADEDRNDNVHWLDVYYVRITNFHLDPPTIYQARLTPQSFRLVDNSYFLGEYHHMAVTGATVYVAYIAVAQDGSGAWTQRNCYLHKIRITCMLGDFNGNGKIDADDSTEFAKAYGAGDPEADLNADGSVNEQDNDLFWQSYNSGK